MSSVMTAGDGTVYEEPPAYVDPGATTGDGQEISERTEEPVMTVGGEAPDVEVDEDSTKAELYEAAQEKDIEGRSKMSKRELAKALEDA